MPQPQVGAINASAQARPVSLQVMMRPPEVSRPRPCLHVKRRSLLQLIGAGVVLPGMLNTQPLVASEMAGTAQTPPSATRPMPSVSDIYANYKYAQPEDVLPFLYDHADRGDPEGVLRAIDTFSDAFPMFKIGPEKGLILDKLVALAQPKLAVELGSFIGYSAVRITRLLPPGAKLVCVEANPECVATMEGVLTYAGLRDRVVIEQGLSDRVLPALRDQYGQAQLLFEDHCKPCYLRDLRTAEATGLLAPGAWTIADNIFVPLPLTEYLEHLRDPAAYRGLLVRAKYEYEQKWNPDWDPDKVDAMSLAVRVAGLTDEEQLRADEQLRQLCQQLGDRCSLLTPQLDEKKELPKLLSY